MKTKSDAHITVAGYAHSQGNQQALVDAPNRAEHSFGQPKSLTFDELDAAVWYVVCELYDAGLRHGDKAVLQLPNITEHVIAALALSRLGITILPVAMHTDTKTLADIAKTSRPSAYISTANHKSKSFICAHQSVFADNTLILAFGETEPESAQLIGKSTADIEALDSCQTYVRKLALSSPAVADETFPLDLGQIIFDPAK